MGTPTLAGRWRSGGGGALNAGEAPDPRISRAAGPRGSGARAAGAGTTVIG